MNNRAGAYIASVASKYLKKSVMVIKINWI